MLDRAQARVASAPAYLHRPSTEDSPISDRKEQLQRLKPSQRPPPADYNRQSPPNCHAVGLSFRHAEEQTPNPPDRFVVWIWLIRKCESPRCVKHALTQVK